MTEGIMGLLGVIIAMTGVAIGLLVRISKAVERIEARLNEGPGPD